MAEPSENLMDKLTALCKRRGFIFQSSEIYGGIGGFWDYGPLGVELKRNIKDAWWADVVRKRDDMVGLDCSIIMNPKVWEASGHVGGFTDPMVDCKQCKARFRADRVFTVRFFSKDTNQPVHAEGVEAETPEQAEQLAVEKAPSKARRRLKRGYTTRTYAPGHEPCEDDKSICPACGALGQMTDARKFNLMFKTHVGAMEDSSSIAYLRPETAQGIFANYRRYQWYVGLGLVSTKLHLRNHEPEELAHYAKSCADVEYDFPFGTSELEGIANRTDFDLTQHQKFSGRDMTYFDEETKERFIPYVIEPSGGVDRAALAFLCEAYTEDEAPDEKGKMQPRTLMKLHPRLAPIKAAVFPLVNREGMPEAARAIYEALQASGMACFYDAKGAVGRRYRRQDEAGTPYCVTVDGQTLQDRTVTVRDRDSLKQERIGAEEVVAYVKERIG